MTDVNLVIGVDIGTQGARAVLVTPDGTVVARAEHPLRVPPPGPEQEQSPEDWWAACANVVRELGPKRREARSIAVSCTSGSVCALDGDGGSVGPGLLYSDTRGRREGGVDPSWALAKIGWMVDECPEIVGRATLFTSPGGSVTGRLLGRPAPLDVTQALKFGLDPASGEWHRRAVDADRLPQVVATGAPIGTIDPVVADRLGLAPTIEVVAGATDGIAAQLACRPAPDRWVTTIGTTIVWKAMSTDRIDGGGVYSHLGPDGWWFPGAASNAGARILSSWATATELADLASSSVVTSQVDAVYPLLGRGERFPFADGDFAPWSRRFTSPSDRYAAEVLGIAFVERWGCDVLVGQGCERPQVIATAGGVVASPSFTQLRCDVLGVPIEVAAEPSSAFGAAVIAAAPLHGGLLRSADAMVHFPHRFEPDPSRTAEWAESFEAFRSRCQEQRETRR